MSFGSVFAWWYLHEHPERYPSATSSENEGVQNLANGTRSDPWGEIRSEWHEGKDMVDRIVARATRRLADVDVFMRPREAAAFEALWMRYWHCGQLCPTHAEPLMLLSRQPGAATGAAIDRHSISNSNRTHASQLYTAAKL